MKFICTHENLLQGLTQVTPVTGRNSQLPILQHILLQCREGTLHLTGTDLEVGVHTTIGGKGVQRGSCTVPARNFFEYTQQLPPTNPITLEKKDTTLYVATEGFHAQFSAADPEDFPLLPTSDNKNSISTDGPLFPKALNRTLFAAAREDTRPEIHSIYLHTHDNHLYIAATDSFRLAEEIIPLAASESLSLLLPLSTAQEIVRLFGDSKSVNISPSQNHASIRGEGVELSSRLIDGNYPDYQQIIPQSHTVRIRVDCTELLRALKTLTVFLPRDSRRVQLTVQPKAGRMTARVAGSESGQGDVQLTLTGEGKDVEILLNIQYLIEGLQHIPTTECTISFIGSQDPVVFRPVGGDIRYVYVVMPIQSQ